MENIYEIFKRKFLGDSLTTKSILCYKKGVLPRSEQVIYHFVPYEIGKTDSVIVKLGSFGGRNNVVLDSQGGIEAREFRILATSNKLFDSSYVDITESVKKGDIVWKKEGDDGLAQFFNGQFESRQML